MAEQEIDKLLLEIEVDDKTQGGSKKLVDDFATAVSKLNEQIAKLDVSKFETIAKAMTAMGTSGSNAARSTKKASAELKQANKELAELQKQYEDFKNSGVQGEALESIRQQLRIPEAEQRVAELQKQGGTAPQLPDIQNAKQVTSLYEAQSAVLADIQEQLKNKNLSSKDYIKLKKQELTLEKQLYGTGEKSIGSAIKRVAMYRAIRGLLKTITNAFKEGFNNLAQYSEEVNNTLSQVTSSFTVMKNSVAVAFLPLLNAFAPAIQWVANGVANLANSISYLTAKLSGNATYLKVNTDYLKKMNEQSRLLSFDTFEKLGGGTDYSEMFEEANVAEGFDSEKLASALTILTAISGILLGIGASKIIGLITGGGLVKGISSVVKSLNSVSNTVGIIVAGVVLLVAGIADLVTSWNNVNFEVWEQVVTIVMAVVAGIVGAVVAAKALTLTVPAALGLGAALTGGILLLGTELSKMTPKNYAFGGGYDSADLFYANENGQTELIASTNSGGGAVMNMQQLESAIYSGMIKAMASNSNNGESAVYLDGNKVGTFVASNSGFRNEANRRMTGLNWR